MNEIQTVKSIVAHLAQDLLRENTKHIAVNRKTLKREKRTMKKRNHFNNLRKPLAAMVAFVLVASLTFVSVPAQAAAWLEGTWYADSTPVVYGDLLKSMIGVMRIDYVGKLPYSDGQDRPTYNVTLYGDLGCQDKNGLTYQSCVRQAYPVYDDGYGTLTGQITREHGWWATMEITIQGSWNNQIWVHIDALSRYDGYTFILDQYLRGTALKQQEPPPEEQEPPPTYSIPKSPPETLRDKIDSSNLVGRIRREF